MQARAGRRSAEATAPWLPPSKSPPIRAPGSKASSQLKATDIRVDPETPGSVHADGRQNRSGRSLCPGHPRFRALWTGSSRARRGRLPDLQRSEEQIWRTEPTDWKTVWSSKDRLGFDRRFVFHSMRKTVAHLFETAECPPGVAKDIIGHAKTDMTFGIYSGETRMDHRARWLAKAICYPSAFSNTGSNGAPSSAKQTT